MVWNDWVTWPLLSGMWKSFIFHKQTSLSHHPLQSDDQIYPRSSFMMQMLVHSIWLPTWLDNQCQHLPGTWMLVPTTDQQHQLLTAPLQLGTDKIQRITAAAARNFSDTDWQSILVCLCDSDMFLSAFLPAGNTYNWLSVTSVDVSKKNVDWYSA